MKNRAISIPHITVADDLALLPISLTILDAEDGADTEILYSYYKKPYSLFACRQAAVGLE